MTENEAIKYLTQANPKYKECVELVDMQEVWNSLPQAIYVAEKALEEIQQYRAIGTVDECLEAMEKQREMLREKLEIFESITYYQCPICNGLLHANENYCWKCGQAILWERDNE